MRQDEFDYQQLERNYFDKNIKGTINEDINEETINDYVKMRYEDLTAIAVK